MGDPDATARLAELWAGEFGNAYVERNRKAARGRREFWVERLRDLPIGQALEVGCNVGGNLVWLAELLGPENVAGIDINETAVDIARSVLPQADLRTGAAHQLPFEDESFDLVLTMGVLIHVPPDDVNRVIAEVVRCTRRFVLCGEYYAEELEEIPYRGELGALFKQDYGGLYRRLYPELELRDSGFLPASEGVWDDVTWWLLEKR